MSISNGTMSASYQVGFVTNLLERLYKDSDHRITLQENQTALTADSTVAQYSATALQTNGLLATDALKSAATSTQKLYDKKTNFDKTFAALFANDTNGVTISDVRKLFGQNIDQEVFGGRTLNQVIDMRTTLQAQGKTASIKDLDMWVHAQGSHEGDLVGLDGKRIGAISPLQAIDPITGKTVETADEAKARSTKATADAPPANPLGALASPAAFKAELNRQLSGGVDTLFIDSEVTGHKAKGDFIENILIQKMGAQGVQSVADTNHSISDNAAQFLKDFKKIGGGDNVITRVDGGIYFKNLTKTRNTTSPPSPPSPPQNNFDPWASFGSMFASFIQRFFASFSMPR